LQFFLHEWIWNQVFLSCPLPPPSPTTASAVSKCSQKDVVTGGFFRMLIIVLFVTEKWIQLF
jgi:hypothetical protein